MLITKCFQLMSLSIFDRINEFQAQLEDMIQSKKQMEILLSEMSGGLRQVSNKVDSQGSKFSGAISEMMLISKRLENEHRHVVCISISSFFMVDKKDNFLLSMIFIKDQ